MCEMEKPGPCALKAACLAQISISKMKNCAFSAIVLQLRVQGEKSPPDHHCLAVIDDHVIFLYLK